MSWGIPWLVVVTLSAAQTPSNSLAQVVSTSEFITEMSVVKTSRFRGQQHRDECPVQRERKYLAAGEVHANR